MRMWVYPNLRHTDLNLYDQRMGEKLVYLTNIKEKKKKKTFGTNNYINDIIK